MAGTNPRAARIAALIQRVVASSIEHELHDKRLSSITVTEVRVTNDLQIAKIYWTQLGHEGHEDGERKRAQQALDQAKGHLRTLVGHKAGLRLTPQLQFVFDEVPGEAHEIEDILAMAKKRDEDLARARDPGGHVAGQNAQCRENHHGQAEQRYDKQRQSFEHESHNAYFTRGYFPLAPLSRLRRQLPPQEGS